MLDIKNADDIETFVLSLLQDEHGITSKAYNHLRDLFHEVPGLDYIWDDVDAIDGRFFLAIDNPGRHVFKSSSIIDNCDLCGEGFSHPCHI